MGVSSRTRPHRVIVTKKMFGGKVSSGPGKTSSRPSGLGALPALVVLLLCCLVVFVARLHAQREIARVRRALRRMRQDRAAGALQRRPLVPDATPTRRSATLQRVATLQRAADPQRAPARAIEDDDPDL